MILLTERWDLIIFEIDCQVLSVLRVLKCCNNSKNVSFERLKQLFSTNAEFVCIEGEYRLILVVCKSLEGWKGAYLIFVTGATGGARVNFFCPV